MKISKQNKWIFGGLAAIAAYVLYRKFWAASNLVFAPGEVTGISIQGTNPIINFNVAVQNTSDTSLQLQSFAGNIFMDNQLIGNVSAFQPVLIAANSQTQFPVTGVLQGLQVINQLITAWNTNSIQKKVIIDGSINGIGFQVPVKLDFIVGV